MDDELGGRRVALTWGTFWLVVAALVVLPYVHSYRHLSPFDEMVHVDYLVKLEHGHLVRGGEKVGPVAAHEQACRGSDIAVSPRLPRCRPAIDPATLPGQGYSTANNDPPLYYAVTGAVAKVVDALPGVDDPVTAARSVGVLWLAGGLLATFWLALVMGASRLGAAGTTLLVGTAPTVAHATATVTSDAPELLAGAVLCLVAQGVVRGRLPWWSLAPAAAAAAAVKASSLTVAGLVVVYLLLHLFRARRGDVERRTVWLSALATLVSSGVVLGGWGAFSAARAVVPAADIPQNQLLHVDSLGWTASFAPNVYALVSPLQAGYLPPFLNGWSLTLLIVTVNLLLMTGVFALVWLEPAAAEATSWAIASVIAMFAGGPALVVLIYLGSHTSILIPARYGLSIVPAVAGCLAVAASRSRAGGYALVALGATTMVAMLAQTL